MPAKERYDLIIIGGGPAGIGAAVQARLYGLKTLVISTGNIGGRLALARRVENFPWPIAGGQPAGRALCRRLERWAEHRGVRARRYSISRVEFGKGLFASYGRPGKPCLSRAVIIATGARPGPWRVAGDFKRRDRIVENWRLVPRPRGACVAVIGGGEVAFDQACSLAERGAEVVLLMRGKSPRAHPGLAAEAARLGVGVVGNMPVKSVRCDDRGAVLQTGNGRRYCCDYVLPAVGHRPQLPDIGRSARSRLGRGLWLAGDVREKNCRQAAVAFGDGVRAAMLAWEYLRKGQK